MYYYVYEFIVYTCTPSLFFTPLVLDSGLSVSRRPITTAIYFSIDFRLSLSLVEIIIAYAIVQISTKVESD